MSYVIELKNGKVQIDKSKSFCEMLKDGIPNESSSFQEVIREFDKEIKNEHPEVGKDALKNAHGDWYEWLVAIAAWNYHVKYKTPRVLVKLPNVKRFDVSDLYIRELKDLIDDLRQKLERVARVRLVTSNPDFAVIDILKSKIESPYKTSIHKVNAKVLDIIDNAYKFVVNKCAFDELVGFLAVKYSLRPDRRLQIPHEGSLHKAIYAHLQTRLWEIAPQGIKYYAVASSVGDADRKALRTVATHSIPTVQSVPEAAVDEIFEVDSFRSADKLLKAILTAEPTR